MLLETFYVGMALIPLLVGFLLSTFTMSCSKFVFGHCWRNLADVVIVMQP